MLYSYLILLTPPPPYVLLQNAIFWPNGSQDHKLPFLTFIPNAPRIVNLKGHGHGVKIKVATSFFWKITYSSKKGMATLIFTPRPCPFRFTILGALGIKVKKGSLWSCEPLHIVSKRPKTFKKSIVMNFSKNGLGTFIWVSYLRKSPKISFLFGLGALRIKSLPPGRANL